MASDANTNRAISVDSNGDATRPSKRQMQQRRMANRAAAVSSNEAAARELDKEQSRLRRERWIPWIISSIIGVFVWMTAVTSTLAETDVWQSKIWLALLVVILPAFAVVFYKEPTGTKLKRVSLAVIAVLILFFGWLFIIYSFMADDVWAFFAGNEIMQYPGVWNSLATILGNIPLIGPFLEWLVKFLGPFVNFGLTFVLPVYLLLETLRALYIGPKVSARNVIIWAALTALSFIFPIGQSILGNSGF